MRALRLGMHGEDVADLQAFLRGRGHDLAVDGHYGPRTRDAVIAYQISADLAADGIAGARTLGSALRDGMPGPESSTPADRRESPNWPPKPLDLIPTNQAARMRIFGEIQFEHAPQPGNGEAIKVLRRGFQLVEVQLPLQWVQHAPPDCRVWVHEAIAKSCVGLWRAWEDAGLLDRVLTWGGSFAERFVRGSRKTLSNHSWGTAFDVNVQWNPLGAQPADFGRRGCVRELVELANAHGWYWGGHFSRPDGMHFEATEKAIQ